VSVVQFGLKERPLFYNCIVFSKKIQRIQTGVVDDDASPILCLARPGSTTSTEF
jgi:hypothetical protein